MAKLPGGLPVKTRLPLSAWLAAGLVTFLSSILHSHQVLDAAPQLATVGHLFSHASVF
jgi:hypothetical protein